MLIYDLMLRRLSFCDSVIKDAEKKALKLPMGSLKAIHVHYKDRDAYQYYERTNGKDPNGRYLGKAEMELAKQLAQREYYERVLKVARREKKLIESLADGFKSDSILEAYRGMKEGKRILVEPYLCTDDEFAAKWQGKKYEGGPFDENDPEMYTKKGERVRSKSEQIIADRLKDAGIPYRYEYPFIYEGNRVIHTDFTVLNKRTRAEYRWEHFGRMDDPKYRKTFFWKQSLYAQYGYMPGVNIIYTFEDKDNPLDTRYLDRLIKKFFL